MQKHSRPKSLRIRTNKEPQNQNPRKFTIHNLTNPPKEEKMQQRLWSYSSRVPDQEHTVVAIGSAAPRQPQLKHHHHHNPRTNPDGLPHYDPRSGFGKKEGSWRSVSAEKWIHVIPVIVLFCLFVLWWFSVSGITNWDRVWVSWVYLFDFFDGFLFLGN